MAVEEERIPGERSSTGGRSEVKCRSEGGHTDTKNTVSDDQVVTI